MKNFWISVNKVIRNSDILLLLLDARMVDETRHKEIEEKVNKAEKPLIYVITKCDLVDKSDVEKHKKKLHPSVFVSAKDRHGTLLLRERILIEAHKKLPNFREYRIGVLGYPNVGKSSLINTLKGRKAAPTSSMSGFTKGVQNIRTDAKLMFIDTPGVIPYEDKDKLKHAMIGSEDYTKVKDPEIVIEKIMDAFPGKLEDYFGVPKHEDKEKTIEVIAKKKNLLKKGGKGDILRTSRMILKDWQEGKIS